MTAVDTAAELRAITIRQPHPFLFVRGERTVETRGQQCTYRGPVALHAAAGVDHIPTDEPRRFGGYEVERDAGGLMIRSGRIAWPYRLPLGEIVAVAQLVDCLPIVEAVPISEHDRHERVIQVLTDDGTGRTRVDVLRREPEGGQLERELTSEARYGDFTPGRYGLVLTDVVRLRRPVPARGQQAVPWRVPDDVAARVREQLAVAS